MRPSSQGESESVEEVQMLSPGLPQGHSRKVAIGAVKATHKRKHSWLSSDSAVRRAHLNSHFGMIATIHAKMINGSQHTAKHQILQHHEFDESVVAAEVEDGF